MEKYTELFKPSFLKNEMRPAIPVDATPTMAYIPLQLDLMRQTKHSTQARSFQLLINRF